MSEYYKYQRLDKMQDSDQKQNYFSKTVGSWKESSGETLKLLFQAHCPESKENCGLEFRVGIM